MGRVISKHDNHYGENKTELIPHTMQLFTNVEISYQQSQVTPSAWLGGKEGISGGGSVGFTTRPPSLLVGLRTKYLTFPASSFPSRRR